MGPCSYLNSCVLQEILRLLVSITCKARGVFFFKAEYDKVREKIETMDRERLLLRQEEWKQMCNSEKEVDQLLVQNIR